MADLVTIPGVGRKTANVVRSVASACPDCPVDTHVGRLSRRLGLTDGDGSGEGRVRPRRASFRPRSAGAFSLRLILHGRGVCASPAGPRVRLRAQRLLPISRIVTQTVPKVPGETAQNRRRRMGYEGFDRGYD